MNFKQVLIFALIAIVLCSAVKNTNKGIGEGDDCIIWRANCITGCINTN